MHYSNGILSEIEDDDSGIFDEWAKVILTENIAYASSLYSQNPSINDTIKKYTENNTIEYGETCINLIKQLVLINEKNNNNDETGLISVFKAYVSRHLYNAYRSSDLSKAKDWLNISLKEWKALLNSFGDNSIDSKLFENFEMEYYLTLSDYLKIEDNDISDFERIMYLADIDEYIARNEKKNSIHSYVKKIIEDRNMNS